MRDYIFIGLCSFLACSCSSTKIYPVCYYGSYPRSIAAKDESISPLLKRLKAIDPDAHVTADGRWIIANTTYLEHKELSEYWPRIACIGPVTSGSEVKKQKDCIDHIKYIISNQEYLSLDIKGNIINSDEAIGPAHVICRCGDEYITE